MIPALILMIFQLDSFQFSEIPPPTQTLAASNKDAVLKPTPCGFQDINYVVNQALKFQHLKPQLIFSPVQSTVVQVATAQNLLLIYQPSYMIHH
jgi:hypothetical protein